MHRPLRFDYRSSHRTLPDLLPISESSAGRVPIAGARLEVAAGSMASSSHTNGTCSEQQPPPTVAGAKRRRSQFDDEPEPAAPPYDALPAAVMDMMEVVTDGDGPLVRAGNLQEVQSLSTTQQSSSTLEPNPSAAPTSSRTIEPVLEDLDLCVDETPLTSYYLFG